MNDYIGRNLWQEDFNRRKQNNRYSLEDVSYSGGVFVINPCTDSRGLSETSDSHGFYFSKNGMIELQERTPYVLSCDVEGDCRVGIGHKNRTSHSVSGKKRVSQVIWPEQDEAICFYVNYDISSEVTISNIKLEQGTSPTPWCPAIEDCELDFIEPNICNGTSDQWSDWITPKYDIDNATGYWGSISEFLYFGNIYSRGIEIEFDGVEIDWDANKTNGNQNGFILQGTVDGSWSITDDSGNLKYFSNPFTVGLVSFPWGSSIENKVYIFSSSILIENGERKYLIPPYLDEGRHVFRLGYRANFWKSGSFRFRKYFAKRGSLVNPLWTRSKKDVANPNLFKGGEAENLTGSYWHTAGSNSDWGNTLDWAIVSVENFLDPYLTEGYKITKTNSTASGNALEDESLISYWSEKDPGQYTFSFYLKVLSCQSNTRGWFQWGYEKDSGSSRTYITLDRRFASEICDLDQWTRLEYTLDISDSFYRVGFYIGFRGDVEYEVCGMKLEKGSKATAWIPYEGGG